MEGASGKERACSSAPGTWHLAPGTWHLAPGKPVPRGSETGTPGFERPDTGDAARLWNIAPLVPEEQRFSRVHAGRPELIDPILVSRLLLDHVTGAGTGTPAQESPLPSVDENPGGRHDAAGSDHAPVWARTEP